MTEDMVKVWADAGAAAASSLPSVQTRKDMLQNLANKIAALNRVADRLYIKWIAGIEY
jgi:hypothetical protein